MRQFWLTMLALTLAHTTALAVERPDFSPPVGEQMDLSAQLTDEVGETESLAQFARGRPAVIMFGYHNCPNLCGVSQQVVAEALSGTGLEADSYSPLFITLTSSESPSDALGAKQRLAEAVGEERARDWHFLSGGNAAEVGRNFGISALERERISQFVHPVAVYTLTSDGHISSVTGGLDITKDNLRLAIVQASDGKVGNLVDQVLLFCAGYDPTGRFSGLVLNAIRYASIAGIALALLALVLSRRSRKWGH